MKKIIVSLLLSLSVIGVINGSINKVQAYEKKIAINSNMSVTAESWQWENRNGEWLCATPDFHQCYANAWIYSLDSGNWYYVNQYGYMMSNIWVWDDKWYYLDSTGAWDSSKEFN